MQDPSYAGDADSTDSGMPIAGGDTGNDQSIVDQFFGEPSAKSPVNPLDQILLNPDDRAIANRAFPKGEDGQEPSPDELKRWEFQQARADKFQNELIALREEKARTEHLKPLADLIESDPELLSLVEKRMQGVEQPKPLQPPTMPVRPENFNSAEANDPNTPSGKYVREVEAYKDARMEYLDKRLQQQEQRLRQEDESRAQQAQARSYMMNVRNELIAKHQFQPEEAEHFLQLFSDPRSRSTAFLAKYYRFLTAEGQSGASPSPTGNRSRSPLPPAGGGRLAAGDGDAQSRFNNSVRSWVEKSKAERRT